MNIQTLHVALLILVSVIFFEQVNKRKASEIIQSSQDDSDARALAEATRAAEEAVRAAEAASQASTENLEETTNDSVSMIGRATTETKIAEQTPQPEQQRSQEQVSQNQKEREMISITNPSKAPRTLDCNDKDVELIAPSLNVDLNGRCGRVRVGGPNSIVTIEYAEYVRVSGPDSIITIESAESLEVSGPESVVNIGRVDHISVHAPDAKVYYSRTLTNGDLPKIEVFGPNVTVNRH